MRIGTLIWLVIFCVSSLDATVMQLSLDPIKTQQKMKLLLYVVDTCDEQVVAIASKAGRLIACPLETKNGFDLVVRKGKQLETVQQMKAIYNEGFLIAIFISYDSLAGAHVWRLYDTMRNKMQATGLIKQTTGQLSFGGEEINVANAWWRVLLGTEPLFSTAIAYCAERQSDAHMMRDLQVVRFGGEFQNKLTVVRSKKILMPRWYPDVRPVIFYSEITPFNIRLVLANVATGKKTVVVNSKGSSFAPSYCSNGTALVYCHSREGVSQLIRFDASGVLPLFFKGHKASTFLSPILLDSGDILFCSDAKGSVQVFYYDASKESVRQLTFGASAQCADYCKEKNAVVFIRAVNGVAQLFTVSCADGTTKQLTFDAGSKDECHWSPQGDYIVYAHSANGTSRIACFNCTTHESFFITDESLRCVHPSWSFGSIFE